MAHPATRGFLSPQPPPTWAVFWHHSAPHRPWFTFTTISCLNSTPAPWLTPPSMVSFHHGQLLPKWCSGTIAPRRPRFPFTTTVSCLNSSPAPWLVPLPTVFCHHDHLLPKQYSSTITRLATHGFPSPPPSLALMVLQHYGSPYCLRFPFTTTTSCLNGVLAPSRASPPTVSLHHHCLLPQQFSSTMARPTAHGFLSP
jgi:hypothetical protein